MSTATVDAVLRRTAENAEFLDQFLADPDQSLAEYELSDQEREVLRSGDESKILEAAGRMTHARYAVVIKVPQV